MTEERRLAAIMFVDICGFSKIMGEDEARALEIVDMAVSCIEQAATEYSGRIIKKLGDGVMAEFGSAVNAVRSALDVQRAVARHNQRSEDVDRFLLRIGIHVGDVVVADGDIFGDGVNIAARIEPLAEPGGICVSRDVLDLIANKISIETVRLGPKDLKNIARKVDIYSVLIDAVKGSKTTIRRPPRGRAGKHKWVWWAVGGGIVALLLLILSATREQRFQNQALRQFRAVTTKARQAIEEGKPEDALVALKSYPERFKDTQWQQELDSGIQKIRDKMAVREIRDRQMRFLKAVQNDDRKTAMSLIDPNALREVDASTLWRRLRIMAGLFKMARVGSNSFEIEKVVCSDDGTSATAYLKVFRRTHQHPDGVWDKVPSTEWRLVAGEWLIHVKQSAQTSDRKPYDGKSMRRKPKRGWGTNRSGQGT